MSLTDIDIIINIPQSIIIKLKNIIIKLKILILRKLRLILLLN